MESLKKYLNGIYPLSNSVLDEYLSHWSEFHLPKKQLMTSPGQVEKYLYFAKEGIQKSYYLKNGKQHVLTFACAPSFSGILESFFVQKPSRYFLETISDSLFLRIPSSKHQEMLQKHSEIGTLFRKVTEVFLDGVIQRQHELMALDMETRFRVFTERSAHLLQKIPQKDISSYLRIDATNFSKLINNIPI